MTERVIKIGSRGSKLALAQTNQIISLIKEQAPAVLIELVTITTSGDADRKTALEQIGGQGLFTKKIEQELLDGNIDIAVHSAKDLPSVMTAGLVIGAVPEREIVNDALMAEKGVNVQNLPGGAKVGTGSPRRRAQLLHLRPDLRIEGIRGNVETRLRKLAEGKYDALIMAAAGLKRLNLIDHISELLDSETYTPAPGQGALVIQTRKNDQACLNLLEHIDHTVSHRCLDIERLLLAKLGAGCSSAVGGLASIDNGYVRLSAVVLDRTGKTRLHADERVGDETANEILVDTVVEQLSKLGATTLIAEGNRT